MSRLVPARPQAVSPPEELVLLELERALDDAHVVFQKRPVEGYLVAHPDTGFCLVTAVAGERAWDPDAEAFEGLDSNVAEEAAAVLAAPVGHVVALPEMRRPDGFLDARFIFSGELVDIADAVARGMRASAPVGVEGIDAAIQALAPAGAASYLRGAVTEAQARWRAEAAARFGSPAPASLVIPALATAPADASSGAAAEPAARQTDASPAIVATATPTSDGRAAPELRANDPLLLLLRQAVETAADGKPIFIAGLQVSAIDATAPDFLLPALIVAAAEDWAPVVATRQGKGGFHVRLRTDEKAVLGYRVVGLSPATPLLMTLPVVDKIRRARKGAECSFDGIVQQFARWLAINRFDTEAVSDIEIRVAMSV